MKELSLVAKVDTMWANSTLPHHGAIRDKQEGSCPNSLDLAGPPHDAVSVRLHSAALLPLFQFTNAGFAGIAFWDIPTKLAYSLNLKKKKKKENRAKRHHWLLVHIHVWKSISGFELMPWNNNFSMLLFRLHVWGQLNPKVTCCFHWLRRYQEETKYSGKGKKFRKHLMEGILVHVCIGGGGEST